VKFNFELAAKILMARTPDRDDVAQIITEARGLFGESMNLEERCRTLERKNAFLEQENVFLCDLIDKEGEKNVL
jgi:hypothetical protein